MRSRRPGRAEVFAARRAGVKKRKRLPLPRRHQQWTRFVESPLPDTHPLAHLVRAQPGYVGTFVNNRYQVQIKTLDSEMFGERCVWLAIVRLDRAPVHDWRDLQRIKNELCGPECEALELYPAESRLVDTNNQAHLFVMPEGTTIPLGYIERDVADRCDGTDHRQRPFAKPPEGLNARSRSDLTIAVFGKPHDERGSE